MQNSLLRELFVHTGLLENGMVELVIADTGSGSYRRDARKAFSAVFLYETEGYRAWVGYRREDYSGASREPFGPRRTSLRARGSSSNSDPPQWKMTPKLSLLSQRFLQLRFYLALTLQ